MTAGPGDRFAVNTYAYTQDMDVLECLSRLADQGYAAFELMVYPGHLWPAELDRRARRTICSAMGQRGLRLISLNMPNVDINIAGASAEMREYSLGLLEGCLDLAGDLGAEGLIIGPGKPNPLFPARHETMLGHFFEGLDRLVPRSEKAGTALWLENMPFSFLPGIDQMMEALDRYGSREIGVCYDAANAWFIAEDIAQGLKSASPRLKLFHLSDTNRDVYRHDPVGVGSVPFADIPPLLQDVGYRDFPVLEIISRDPDRDLAQSADRLIRMGWLPVTPQCEVGRANRDSRPWNPRF